MAVEIRDTLLAETPFRRKGRRMSKRSGQAGYVFSRNGQYVGRFYVDTPERRVRKAVVLGPRSEMTKPEAKRKLLDLLSNDGINGPGHLERALGSAKTFSQVVEQWEAVRLPKLGASSQYINPKLVARHLVPFFGEMPVDDIKTGTINEWIGGSRMKGFEPKTVHNMYKLFRAIVRWHYRQEDKQPPRWSPDLPPLPDKEQRWFTPDEVAKLVGAAPEPYKTLFHLAASSGCRAGELFGLHIEDCNFKRRTIQIVRSVWKGREVPTKTRKGYREVFLDTATTEVLQRFIAGRTSGRVFETENGKPFDDTMVVREVLYPLCDGLKIPRGGLHAFRHGRVSLLRANGAPEDLVKRQIGHSSLRTTSGYTHFSEEYQRELANRLSWTQKAEVGLRQTDCNPNSIN